MNDNTNPSNKQPNNPLHGIKLAAILETLVAECGWEQLGRKVKIRCFTHDPSIKSSLTFLRKTPWARAKVEELYLQRLRKQPKPRQTTTKQVPEELMKTVRFTKKKES